MAQAIENFINEQEAQILAFISSPSAGPFDNWNFGSFGLAAGSLVRASDADDSITFNSQFHQYMKPGGPVFIETYGGNDYLEITPWSNSMKAYWGGTGHDYFTRLGKGDDIVTGISSKDGPLTAFVFGGEGFDYILEDLSTPGWSLTRPYSDTTLVSNTLEGTQWQIADDVEAIGSGNLWYLTKDMAQNKFIPLTWSEVLEGGKRETAVSNKKNRKKNKRKSKKRFK